MLRRHIFEWKQSSCSVSIDGLGEIESSTIYEVKNNKFKLLKRIDYLTLWACSIQH